MTTITRCIVLFLTVLLPTSSAQTKTTAEQVSPEQVAALIGIDKALAECEQLHCRDLRPENATLQQVLLRQQITDTVIAASLDVDGVLAEIANEHAVCSNSVACSKPGEIGL